MPVRVLWASHATKASIAAWSKHLDAKLLFHGAAEAVLHLRPLVGRRRSPLVIRLCLDTQLNEIGAGRRDNQAGGYLRKALDKWR
jgi:hypothetical protein